MKSDALYIVVGGLGGLGKAIVGFLVERGARTILTLSRSGARDEHSVKYIDEMRSRGVSVIAQKCDISSEHELKGVLDELTRDTMIPPIRGVIQSAMVLQVCPPLT